MAGHHSVLLLIAGLAAALVPVPTEARGLTAPGGADSGDACTCAGSSPRLQLIRGDGAASACLSGYYCDCDNRTTAQCESLFYQFNEERQQCALLDFEYCEGLEDELSPAPPTEEAVKPCSCASSTPPLQLVRGERQAERCYDGEYCDCAERSVVRCESPIYIFNEEQQACALTADFEYCDNIAAR